MDPLTYKQSGVDIEAADAAVRRIGPLARSTFRPEVLGEIGAFAGFVKVPAGYHDPVLVSSTDGVGSKLRVAFLADRHDTVGIDLVAMGVNDVLVHGAEPLFFLDYLAVGKVVPERLAQLRVLVVDDNAAAREILQVPLRAVVRQVQAVEAALNKVSTQILEGHLNSCVITAVQGEDTAERERVLKEVLEVFETSTKV